jgi:hypothetical protein
MYLGDACQELFIAKVLIHAKLLWEPRSYFRPSGPSRDKNWDWKTLPGESFGLSVLRLPVFDLENAFQEHILPFLYSNP